MFWSWLLSTARQWWDIQPSLPDGMLWYRRRTQPDWMRVSGREFRHRLGCDTRCTAAAMCSIHVAVSLHVLWDTEDAWKEEIQNPTFFLYNIHITCLIFSPASRYVHQLWAPNQADLTRSHFYPIVVILVTPLWLLPAHSDGLDGCAWKMESYFSM